MLGITFEQTRVYQEAKDEGRKEGVQEGRQEGLQEGGQAEKLAIARNLLNLDLPLDQITNATGLSLEEVQCLRDTPSSAED